MKINEASKTPVKDTKNSDNLTESEKFDKFDLANACSATECTGLIQTFESLDEEELEAYNQVYNFGPPDISK